MLESLFNKVAGLRPATLLKDMKKLITIQKNQIFQKYIAVIRYMSFVKGPGIRIYFFYYYENFIK